VRCSYTVVGTYVLGILLHGITALPVRRSNGAIEQVRRVNLIDSKGAYGLTLNPL